MSRARLLIVAGNANKRAEAAEKKLERVRGLQRYDVGAGTFYTNLIVNDTGYYVLWSDLEQALEDEGQADERR